MIPAILLVLSSGAMAWPEAPLPAMDAQSFADKATELFIVKCLDPELNKGAKISPSAISEIDVLSVIKGERQPGKSRLISRPHPMEAGKLYLVAVFRTKPKQPAYEAQSPQAFTEIPGNFDRTRLTGKPAAQQAVMIFEARREQVDTLIQKLQKEKAVLDAARPKVS